MSINNLNLSRLSLGSNTTAECNVVQTNYVMINEDGSDEMNGMDLTKISSDIISILEEADDTPDGKYCLVVFAPNKYFGSNGQFWVEQELVTFGAEVDWTGNIFSSVKKGNKTVTVYYIIGSKNKFAKLKLESPPTVEPQVVVLSDGESNDVDDAEAEVADDGSDGSSTVGPFFVYRRNSDTESDDEYEDAYGRGLTQECRF